MSLTLPTAGNAYQRAQASYGSTAASTASPARLVVMLYDRLLLDLRRAHQFQVDGEREPAHDNLSHAQEIVAELLSSLDVDAWDGGRQLASLYQWLMAEMIRANTRMEPQRVLDCVSVVEPLRDAWAQALELAGGQEPRGLPVGLTG